MPNFKIFTDPCVDCGKPYYAKGRCRVCYYRQRRHDNPDKHRKLRLATKKRVEGVNPEKYKAIRTKYARKRRKEVRELIKQLKSVPCMDCNTMYPSFVMDFDHVPERGEKSALVSRMTSSASRKQILGEISKCDVVCSNCHRIRTYQRNAGKA